MKECYKIGKGNVSHLQNVPKNLLGEINVSNREGKKKEKDQKAEALTRSHVNAARTEIKEVIRKRHMIGQIPTLVELFDSSVPIEKVLSGSPCGSYTYVGGTLQPTL